MTLMNLDKLKAIRDDLTICPLPISEEEMIARYEKLFSGAVSDVLREHALPDQVLPNNILPLRTEMTVAGFAFTIKSAKDPTIEGEMIQRAKMLDAIKPGSFCVWETGGDDESAHWGEMMTAVSKQRGARAAAVDGGLRDTHKVLAQDFPVFYKYRTPNGSLSRCKTIGFQVPIRIGKVIIKPGDLVFGDIDGVVICPRSLAYEVLLRAEEICGNETDIKRWILSGISATEIAEKGGYF
jgi:regulator of RNase E activity RraA